jgi:translation initiation factor IF-3
MAHKEFGFQQVEKLINSLTLFGHPDAPAKLIGKGINVMLSPLPRAKRGRNPRENGRENGEAVSAQPEATNHFPAPEQHPVEAVSGGSQEFGNNAFASLEFKSP